MNLIDELKLAADIAEAEGGPTEGVLYIRAVGEIRGLAEDVERWKKAAEANIEENVQLRRLFSDMEAARDAALRLHVERQPELGRIADALCEYNESDTRDAVRYRWLRHNFGCSIANLGFGPLEMRSFRDEHLDALIDGAMDLTPNEPS